jgi:hypothetical protein
MANVGDIDTGRWVLTFKHPKGEGTWGEERDTPILPAARPMISRYLKARADVISRHGLLN